MESRKDYRVIMSQAHKIMFKYGYSKTVAAEIRGKLLYLTEGEVRALQIMAKQKAEESEEAFKEFCDEVVVYSGCKKRSSKHRMIFQEDGCFKNEFENGFFSACAMMSLELLRSHNRLPQ